MSDHNSVDLDKLKAAIETSSDVAGVNDQGLRGELDAFVRLHNEVRARCQVEIAQQVSIAKTSWLLNQWASTDTQGKLVYDEISQDQCGGTVAFDGGPIIQKLATQQSARYDITADPGVLIGVPPTSGYAGDPVCTANGNFVHQETDLGLVGYAQVINVERTYNALATSCNGMFGKGWTSILDMGVELYAESDLVRVTLADGASVPFRYDAESEGFEPNTRRRLKLARVERDGEFDGWILSNADDQTWRFDAEGVLSGGRYGHAEFVVERSNSSIGLTEVCSQRWVRYFIELGRVSYVTSSDGRRVTYVYDGDGSCIEVQRPGGGVKYEIDGGLIEAIIDADGVTICRNDYDAEGRVTSQEQPHGAVSTFEYLENRVTKVTYSDDGPVNLYSHDAQGNVTAMFGGDGGAMRMSWDNRNRMTKVVDQTGHTTSYEFGNDEDHDLLVRRVDPDGLSESFSYDDQGRVVSEVNRAGGVKEFFYTGASTVPSKIVNADGTEMVTRYDERDLPVEVVDGDGVKTEFMWDNDGQVTTVISATGARTTFIYDRVGRLAKIVDPLGKTAQHSFNDDGQIDMVIDTDDVVRRYTTTAAGRVLSCATDAPGSWSATYNDGGLAATITDATEATTSYEYDQFGQLICQIDPGGNRWQQHYDSLGQVIEVTSPTGASTTYSYDKAGNQIAVTNPDGLRIEREVDWQGRTTKLTEPGGIHRSWNYHPVGELATYTDPTGGVFAYNIDDLGRLVNEIDPEGNTRRYKYSSTGRLIETTSAAGRSYRFDYDGDGRPATIIDPDGRTVTTEYRLDGQVEEFRVDGASTTLTYDNAGRVTGWSAASTGKGLTSTFYPDSVEVKRLGANSSRFDIDPRGLLAKVADPAGVMTEFFSDAAGHVTKAQTGFAATTFGFDNAGQLSAIVDPSGNETSFQRTPGGNVSTISVGGEFQRSYNYDNVGRLASIESNDGSQLVAFAYDLNSHIVEASNDNGTVRIERDRYGQPTAVSSMGGSQTSYKRDADGMLKSRTDPTGQRVDYLRGASGDLTGFDDPEAGHVDTPIEPVDRRKDIGGRITVDEHGRTHRYDDAGRIAETVDANGERYAFNYNDLGLLAEDITPQFARRSYTYNAVGGLERINSDHGASRYVYDTAGRRTGEQHADGGSVEYTWNDLNQLIRFSHTNAEGDKATTKVTYSALGRPEKIGDTTIGWDDAITGKPVRIGGRRYLRSGVKVRLCEPDSQWEDGLVDDPFGYDTPTGKVKFGYRGELAISGLVFMGDRVYQPETRSFLTTDPLPAVPGENTYASPYAYAYNDPINNLDPTGRRPLSQDEFHEVRIGLERTAWQNRPRPERVFRDEILTPVARATYNFLAPKTPFLPWSAARVSYLSLVERQENISLDKLTLDKVKADPAFANTKTGIDDQFVAAIQADPRFGHESFSKELTSELIGRDHLVVRFGGERGDFRDAWRLHEAENRESWGTYTDDLTWTLRNATMSGVADVDASGRIVINYGITDTLDLRPGDGRPDYNRIADPLGKLWHDALGAPESSIHGEFEVIR